MVSDCRYLFYALILLVRPSVICDIGSCDGTEAFKFRRLRPSARIVAFEANPHNFARIATDSRSERIELHAEAASDTDGETTFYVLETPPSSPWARGGSSLMRRGPEIKLGLGEEPVQVRSLRLDTLLAEAPQPIALWVDVEGAAAQVIDGLAGIADRINFMCVELESVPIWDGQETAAAVLDRLSGWGFEVIATTPDSVRQDNFLLVRDVPPLKLRLARAMAFAAQIARRVIP